jgi:cytochrome c
LNREFGDIPIRRLDMKRLITGMIVASMVLGGFTMAYATAPDDAKAMAEKAYAYFKENGKTDTFTAISDPSGQFVKDDLYVLVVDFSGMILADGGNPGFVGVNLIGLKDTNGKYLFKEMIEKAKAEESGWIEYTWLNPATKRIQPKSTYVKRIKGIDAVMACGLLK